MGSREKWRAAAREVTGQEVREAVPVARIKPGGPLFTVVGVLAFAAVVYPYELGLIPGPRLLVFFVGPFAMSLIWQLGRTPVFVLLTPTGLVAVHTSRWRLKPTTPVLGPVDPASVRGPSGLLGNAYDIGGARHQVGWQVRGRFEQMLAVARGEPATS
ncbi:hypothetical protein [Nocardioides taihuensis]|uniref:PH domain-containing protein n=1 Tax=Nocardioides taihuensis TaxID=1835606 RepID=A0ABW0BL99_9ACTN